MTTKDPDPNYSLVWSTGDPKIGVETLLRKNGGNVDQAIKALFGRSCSYATARQLSVTLAPHFGLKAVDFMKKYHLWTKGKL